MAFKGDGIAFAQHNEWEARAEFTISWPDFEVTGNLEDLASGTASSDKLFITADGSIQLRIDYNNYTLEFDPVLSVGDFVEGLTISRDASNNIAISANGQSGQFGPETGKLTLKNLFGTTGAKYTGRVKGGLLTYEGAYNGVDFTYDLSQESGTSIPNTHATGTAAALSINGSTDGVSGLVANQAAGGDTPPTVNAGPDQNINGLQTLTLSSTESDDGSITGVWSQVGASDATINSPANATTTVSIPNVTQTLTFRRTVNDGVNPAVSDDVVINVTQGVAGQGTIKKVNVPAQFAEYFPHDIWEDGSHNFDILNHYQMSASDPTITPQYLIDNGVTRYVDYVNGSNSNNGQSWATPWKTISYARAQVCDVVRFKAGKYWNDCPDVNNLIEGSAKVFICEDGIAEFYACNEDDSGKWAADPTRAGVYMWATDAPSAVYGLWDTKRLTPLGTWGILHQVGNADAVRDGDVNYGKYGGGYYWLDSTNGILYVKTVDGRAPDEGIKVNTKYRWNVGTTGRYAYFEGMAFHYNVKTNTAVSTGAQGLAFNRCFLGYGDDADNSITGMSAGTASRFYILDSVVVSGTKDNLSYQNGPRAVEINTISINSSVYGPNNCSTGHGSAHIIRLGGYYEGASGPTVGDIENVNCLNVACYSADGGGGSFNINTAETTGYFINCVMPSSEGQGIDGGGTVHLYGNDNQNGMSGSLTVVNDDSLVDVATTKEDDTNPIIQLIPPSSIYRVDKSLGHGFTLPRAILKDGITLTNINPSSNNYDAESNGTFGISYDGVDAEGLAAPQRSLTVSQFGYTANAKPTSPVISGATSAQVNTELDIVAAATDDGGAGNLVYEVTVTPASISYIQDGDTVTVSTGSYVGNIELTFRAFDGELYSDPATYTIAVSNNAQSSIGRITILDVPDGLQPIKIFSEATDAKIYEGSPQFTNGVAFVTLPVAVGVSWFGRWLGTNPPQTGTGIFGVSE